MLRRSAVAVLLPLVVACGGPDVQPGLFYPTWRAEGGVPTGIVQGTLVFVNDCLMLEAHGQRSFVIWAEGTRFQHWSLVDGRGEPFAHVGDVIHGGGGYSSDRAHVEALAGRELPERCIPPGDEPFALIYDVEAGPFE